jgi:hypothetical protein
MIGLVACAHMILDLIEIIWLVGAQKKDLLDRGLLVYTGGLELILNLFF